jgi:2-iminoacetate synthase ThiH
MGRMLERAIESAGLTELAERALVGRGLGEADLSMLRAADVLLVAGLADAVRQRHRGAEVRVLTPAALRRAPDVQRLELEAGSMTGPTGQELLLEVALARLATPADRSIGVSFEALGLQLAQTALVFGVDVLWGDLASQRTLPLLDGLGARRAELTGLIERAGRKARFFEGERELETLETRS